MNKKLIIVGCAVALATTAFAKKAIVQDTCVFCGGGTSVIEDDPVPVPSKKGTSTCTFCGEGGSGGGKSSTTYWTSATTRSVNMTGGEYYAGTATIKTGKYSSKKGTVEVSVSFKLKNGKKYSTKKQNVKPDEDWTLYAEWSDVKGIGDVALALGVDGSVEGMAGDYELLLEGVDPEEEDDEPFEHGEHVFSVEMGDYELNEDYDLVWEAIPEFSAIVTSNSKKWDCGKTPSIKYKKFKEDGETWYDLIGIDDEVKTNYSGLKLTFDKKKNTVKGSFKVYATNYGSIDFGKKPKLKSYTFDLKGSLTDGVFEGTATCKKLKANWTFVID